MPQNSLLGQPATTADVTGKATYGYAPTDTYAMVKQIPVGGTTLKLPADPSGGDRYEFGNQDGSCADQAPIIVQPAAGTTILGGQSSTSFSNPFAWGVMVYDESSSDWICYFGNAGPGSGSVLQPAWFVDAVNGNDNNSGATALLPVKTLFEISKRWRGFQQGVRVVLPVSVTITILQGWTNFADAKADPLEPLLNVDLQNGARLLIQQSTSVLQAGAFTAVTPFSRTPGGRQVVGSVFTGWLANQDNLIVDTTKNSVAWLNDTAAGLGGPFGLTSAPYTAANPLSATPTVITLLTFGGTDAFQIIQPNGGVYFGTGSTTRSAQHTGVNAALPSVVFYRLREFPEGLTPTTVGDPLSLGTDGIVQLIFQECQIHQNPMPTGGAVFVNCAFLNNAAGTGVQMQIGPSQRAPSAIASGPAPDAQFSAGYSVATSIAVQQGGLAIFEDDFQLLSGRIVGGAYQWEIFAGGLAGFGNCGRTYVTVSVNANQPAALIGGGATFGIADDNGGASTFYGDMGGGGAFLSVTGVPSGAAGAWAYYRANGGTPAASSFAFTTSTFKLGGAAQGWGFDPAGGTYVGPTTFTLAHLDAVLGAGTGFGNQALEPKSGCRFGLQA